MSVALADPLIAKYDVPGPRYTSYPTVPYWDTTPETSQWVERIAEALVAEPARSAALYLHIPFCRELCTYCGCNTRITRSHSIVPPYIQALLSELDLYLRLLHIEQLQLIELHFGGGTPTFLTVTELESLLQGLFARVRLRTDAVASLEVDPRVTSAAQLELLARHGFRRISLGVQDFDPRVQQIVNRVQSEDQVRQVTQIARTLGFDSVNFDLIYGLPLQTPASVELTMQAVSRLRPDRIALYAYAHVPWIKPGQRRYGDTDLPEGGQKRALYEIGRERLTALGYREIGLDHFALETDSVWQARCAGTLHRNFMGYTTAYSQALIGLGVSAIGDAGNALAQNEKDLQRYQERVGNGELPLQRGHLLDSEDRILRHHIQRLITQLSTGWEQPSRYTDHLATIHERLAEPEADGLVELGSHSCRVTDKGRPYLRNICMAFDARLARRLPDKLLYSRTA